MGPSIWSRQPLRVGVATVDITPPVGCELSGFVARDGPSIGVHDPVYARALVLDNGEAQAVLIAIDLLGLETQSIVTIRRAIEQVTGIPAAHIMIAASHTHSAPASMFLRGCGTSDPVWVTTLPERIAQATQLAYASVRPAMLASGVAAVQGISANRRQPNGPIDPNLEIVRFDDTTGAPLAVLISFACHPIAPGARNRLISADYPGALVRRLEEHIGAPVLFANGACADVNPTPLVNVPIDRNGSFELVEDIGSTLAHAALQTWPTLVSVAECRLHLMSRYLDLPLMKGPSDAQLFELSAQYRLEMQQAREQESSANFRRIAAMMEWVEATMEEIQTGRLREHITAEIQVITLGDVALVGVPGEVFTALGLAIKQRTPFLRTHVLSFTNGNVGYIPAREAYSQDGYEVSRAYRYYGYPSPFAPNAGEMVVETALELLIAAAIK